MIPLLVDLEQEWRGGQNQAHRGALIAQMAARTVRLKYQKLGKLIAAAREGTR